MTVVFYISGHGFGHATRVIEVINTLSGRRPDVRVVVRTSVAKSLFDRSARAPIELQVVDTDSGVAQIDSLRLDEEETAYRAERFYRDFDTRVATEAAVLRHLTASIVVGDVPPLAFAAAREADIPALAVANFTWDWIYESWPTFELLAPGVTEVLADAYAKATLALRLPLHGGFESMKAVTRDIPFIARQSRYSRGEARQRLGLDSNRPVVLASFGGHGAGLPYQEIARRHDFTLVLTDHELPGEGGESQGLKRFNLHAMSELALRYEDVVAASDIVVTKPGYGIVSECVANDTALLYTSRGNFPEYQVMVETMPQMLRCRFIAQNDLMAGDWTGAIEGLLQQPPPPDRPATNGADIATDEILQAVL